jgi:pimeloyl-ACP methyl ester carboxylesterase
VSEPTHRTVETNGIRVHLAEQGRGPVVLLCHGFPESWYSWRHQLPALAAAGFHAVAPDMRGYGRSDRPADIEAYTQLHHVGDMIGVLDALEAETAVIVGHDWGAPVAWHAALMRPDRIRAVAALSVPYTPRGPVPPTQALRAAAGDRFMYMLYFQTPGVAEAELEADVPKTLRRLLYAASGDAPPVRGAWGAGMPGDARLLDAMADPATLPAWLTQADLDFYVGEFRRTGFSGGLNWYRTLDLTWELMAAYQGARIHQPALFIAGDRDGVITRMKARYERLEEAVPGLRRKVLLPGCGHWTQQERAAEVNAELLAFLRVLG